MAVWGGFSPLLGGAALGIEIAPVGLATETETAYARPRYPVIGAGTETDTASAQARVKARAVGLAPTVGAAWSDLTWFPLTEAAANDAFALARSKIRAAGVATETDAAYARSLAPVIGRATETDTAYAAGRAKAKTAATATETESASGLSALKSVAVGLSSVTGTAQSLFRQKARTADVAAVTDSAGGLSSVKALPAGRSDETDTAYERPPLGTIAAPVGRADETDAAFERARYVAEATISGGSVKRRPMRNRPAANWVIVGEMPTIRPPRPVPTGMAAEQDAALALRPVKDYTDQAIVALLFAA